MTESAETTRHVIVVGVDMAETGVLALREAMRLAQRMPGSELHAVYVVAGSDSMHDAAKIDELCDRVERARELLRDHVEKECRPVVPPGAEDQNVVLHVRVGEPGAAILQVTVDEDADTLIVGTHARTGVSRWMMGSVAEELLRNAHCPVVIAHPKDYAGTTKTEQVAPPRPGQDLSGAGYTESLSLRFPNRTSHISGLV